MKKADTQIKQSVTFENLYDRYVSMIYGIALEVSPTVKDAEEIVINTFAQIQQESRLMHQHHSVCVSLIKLVIATAHARLRPNQEKHNFKIRQFEKTPLLHKILCEQMTMETYCKENRLTRAEAAKNFREEFSLLRIQ